MPIGFQVVFRAVDDRVLAPDPGTRRALATTILRIGRDKGLFGTGAGDTHAHAILACNDAKVGRFVHDARLALRARLGFDIAPPSIKPIRDVWHAQSLLGYVHRQDTHHGVVLDPVREATSLPDLLGLRVGNLWVADRVRAVVPRVTRTELLRHWGIEELVEAVDLGTLAEAGAAAVGITTLEGRHALVVEARRACAQATSADTFDVATALGLAPRTVRDLRAAAASPLLVRAVRLQMGLRAAHAESNPFTALTPPATASPPPPA